MKPAQRKPGILRIAVMVAVVIPSAWLALQLARVDGDLGEPKGPDRLVADIELPLEDPDAAATAARQALHDRPIDGRAYRVLAQVAQANGDQSQADRLYMIAAERWPRDRIAQAMLADRAFAAGDIDRGLTHFDALLRVAAHLRTPLLTGLMPHLGDATLRAGLVARLANDPPWRGALVRPLLADTTPVEPAQALLAELAATGPLSEPELQARITLLDRAGRPAEARAVWVRALDTQARAAVANVFDGGFEHPDVSGGYGWQYNPPAGVAIGPDPTDPFAGESALAIVFDGRAVQFAHLRQPLALTPGRYRLQAAAQNDVRTDRAFALRLSCSGGGNHATLAELPLPGDGGWQTVLAGFDVSADCPRQQLQLRHTARTLAERTIRGTLRLDGIAITKQP